MHSAESGVLAYLPTHMTACRALIVIYNSYKLSISLYNRLSHNSNSYRLDLEMQPVIPRKRPHSMLGSLQCL